MENLKRIIKKLETIVILLVGTECNFDYKKPNFTPVVFHNLSGYDSHLFIKNLGFSKGDINCIPNNEKIYISFSKKIEVGSYTNKEGKTTPLHHTIRFIDSFKFMPASLDSLVNNLPKDAFNNVKRYYSGEKFNLLTRKGVYPYEYVDTQEKLKETKLPPKEAFYSKLNNENISDEDYAHAQKVWRVFNMEHFKDYHDLYNKADVLLLADVFENFRNICIENFELDPAHYYTAPGLAWDSALKITGVELESQNSHACPRKIPCVSMNSCLLALEKITFLFHKKILIYKYLSSKNTYIYALLPTTQRYSVYHKIDAIYLT